MAQQEELFRKKSLERISSPEQLQDYMRVTTPGTWMLLLAVIILLGGLLVCSVLGRVETTVSGKAQVQGGTATVEVEEKTEKVEPGMTLRIGDLETSVEQVRREEDGAAYASAAVDLPDGNYDAVIVTESISPITFLVN
ncbi:MAG: hypothetical protein IKG66_04620 [Lachnospiraceae bacterium]|nr:hypothetical protein [Lachnospiraceae bacterium]